MEAGRANYVWRSHSLALLVFAVETAPAVIAAAGRSTLTVEHWNPQPTPGRCCCCCRSIVAEKIYRLPLSQWRFPSERRRRYCDATNTFGKIRTRVRTGTYVRKRHGPAEPERATRQR
jgi:hypothetical protein